MSEKVDEKLLRKIIREELENMLLKTQALESKRLISFLNSLSPEEKNEIEKALSEGKMVIVTHDYPPVRIGGDLHKVKVIVRKP